MNNLSVFDLHAEIAGVEVLKRVSFTLDANESLLIAGHNGAGKSTLLKCIFNLLKPNRGTITFNKKPVYNFTPYSFIEQGVRYLGQGLRTFDDLSVNTHRKVLAHLHSFNVVENSDAAGVDKDRIVRTLSVGQRRLESLNLLSAGEPKLYILDEPSAGLDHANYLKIVEWIKLQKKNGCSFIIVEHKIKPLISILEKSLILRSGAVSYYGNSSTLKESDNLRTYFL